MPTKNGRSRGPGLRGGVRSDWKEKERGREDGTPTEGLGYRV
jgi:hypothetical protein